MTMNLLRIRDNSQIKKEAFYKIKNLETKILNVTLKNLEKEGVFVFPEAILESEDLEQSQMILQDEMVSIKLVILWDLLAMEVND